MTDHTGGTVTYYRADWNDDKRRWEVRFTLTGGIFYFSPAEGGAMGLTVPEPAPLDIDALADHLDRIASAVSHGADPVAIAAKLRDVADAARVRDARQDPQPSADAQAWLAGERVPPQPTADTMEWETHTTGAHSFTFTPSGQVTVTRAPDGGVFVSGMKVAPALSPRQCLEALLAGRDDADELMAHAANESPNPLLMRAVGDAARGGA